MEAVYPEIFLIAKPQMNWREVEMYLDSVGGREWFELKRKRIREDMGDSDSQDLVEFMGRLCYRSWKPGLNANVSKIRQDQAQYFQNLLSSGHGSVLEHANYSFVFKNVSRVFTHELVRHRAGVAISQESLRFVRLQDLSVWEPGVFAESDDTHMMFVEVVEHLEEVQKELAERFGLDEDGVPFDEKKKITSAMRRLAPIGLATTMGWTANIRTIRWVIQMRTHRSAEEEIRRVFGLVAQLMKQVCPLLFSDFEQNMDGEWIPGNQKV